MAQLKEELEAAEGSFVLIARIEHRWDRDAFTRLDRLMRLAAARYEGSDDLPRWLANGCFLVSHIEGETRHEHFSRPEPESYYRACLQRVYEVSAWLFSGKSLYQEPQVEDRRTSLYQEPHAWPVL